MKFTNLVSRLSSCNIGDYVRLSRSTQIVRVVEKGMFITCRLIGTQGTVEIEPKRFIHRKID